MVTLRGAVTSQTLIWQKLGCTLRSSPEVMVHTYSVSGKKSCVC